VKDVAFARGGVCATDARKSARLKHFPLSGTSSGGKLPDQTWGAIMLKILTATAASLAMLGAAAAADLPRKEPPPPAPPVGKAPIGKYPQPVVTKG